VVGLTVFVTDFTEQWEHTQRIIELSESEKLLESINQNIAEGIYRSDEKGLVYVNQAFVKMFGYESQAEVLALDSPLLYKDPNERSRLIEQIKADGFYVNQEVTFVKKSGQEFHALISTITYTDSNGHVYMDGAIRDVTLEREAARIIGENEQLLRSINHNINEAIYRSEKGKGLIYVNDAFVKMFGFDDVNEILESDALNLYKNIIDRKRLGDELIEKGAYTNVEVEFKRKDGQIFWGSLSSIMIEDEDGRIFFDGAIRDISAQKIAETKLDETGKLLESINENISEGIYRSNKDGLIYINKAFVKLFGYESEEEIFNVKSPVLYKNPEQRDRLMSVLDKYGYFENEEVTFLKKDGSEFVGLISSTSYKDASGNTFWDGAIRDIDEQRKAQIQIEDQNNRLKDFSYITSHNIRSSVANFLGLLDIQKSDPSNEAVGNMLRTTAQKLNNTINNINELLNFEKDIGNLSEVPCNLKDTIQHVIELNQRDISGKGIKITLKSKDDAVIHGIPAFLDSIFHNFMTNAIKYCSPDKSNEIEIEVIPHDGGYLITFKDSGIGIDMEKYGDKLFNLGTRFHDETYDGQGLGLFMVKRHVEAMGGRIDVESKLNKGTIFKVWLHE
jgi:PAS domain S-box-containing protein